MESKKHEQTHPFILILCSVQRPLGLFKSGPAALVVASRRPGYRVPGAGWVRPARAGRRCFAGGKE
jgi:hypothetical protein